MTTIDKIITFLTTSPQQQDAKAIAQGTDSSISTIRKNLKRMREAGEVAWEKNGNSTYYTLPQQKQPEVEPSIEQETPEPQVEVEPSIEQEPPATPSFHVNPKVKTTPRVLLDKLRERQAKHRERMNSASSPQEHAKHNRRYKRATRRLEALEAAHA